MHYVQIDENGIPVGDSNLASKVDSPFLIPTAQDFDYTNKKYVDGEWVEYIDPMADVIPDGEEMALEQAMNIQYLVDLAEINQEEV